MSLILFRGESMPVIVALDSRQAGANRVSLDSNRIFVSRAGQSTTPPAQTLENWLRKQAKNELLAQLRILLRKVKREPGKVFVMGQRTKWGNCSKLGNLSFNWRLILGPEFVLRYIVTHEAVHLAIPDHSQRFWLTVQSLCPETERAKRWLSANSDRLLINLRDVC
jgi:predicted metal-dependent hydrolase